jgi:hypothetical protein
VPQRFLSAASLIHYHFSQSSYNSSPQIEAVLQLAQIDNSAPVLIYSSPHLSVVSVCTLAGLFTRLARVQAWGYTHPNTYTQIGKLTHSHIHTHSHSNSHTKTNTRLTHAHRYTNKFRNTRTRTHERILIHTNSCNISSIS